MGANPHFVDNGKQLVTLYGSEQEETLLVYNFASGQMMSKITIRDLGYLQTISLNGKYAIFSKPLKNYSYQYILYNIDHSSVISKLGEGSEIKGADLSLDGRQFVFVDKGIIIGDTSTGLINKRLSHPDYHNGLNMIVDEQRWMYHGRSRFSKDNRYVVYEDRAIIEIWDPAMEKIIWRKENGGNNTICNYCLNFHPETMRYVQAEESYIKMWDVKNNILLFSFIAHLGNILSVAFSNDGKRIISFGEDNKIKLWNAETGKNLFDLNSNIFVNFDGLDYSLDHVFFSFDDSKIICSSLKGTTVVWDYPPLQKLIDDTTEQYKTVL